MKFWPMVLLSGMVGLTACAGAPAPLPPTAPAVVVTPASTPTEAASSATGTLPVAVTPVESGVNTPAQPTDWLTVEGKTADGLTYLGNPDAPITLKDYSDFLWGTCRAYVLGTEPQIRENYVKTGQVKLVFSPVLDLGTGSFIASQAAECAGDQGQFWPMHDVLFREQPQLYGSDVSEVIKGLAAQLSLDTTQFNTCLDEQRYADKIKQLDQQRRELGIRTRPTLDVNGQLIVGAQPFGVFQQVLEP